MCVVIVGAETAKAVMSPSSDWTFEPFDILVLFFTDSMEIHKQTKID